MDALRTILFALLMSHPLLAIACDTPHNSNFANEVKLILSREAPHALFGAEIINLADGKSMYSCNAKKLFKAASTTKLISAAVALQTLGPNFRFQTRVYEKGERLADGTLNGDLILVASGDPNLSGRIQGDKLLFTNEDHTYGGALAEPVGDPLWVVHALAKQIAASGIKKVKGRVVIDDNLYPTGSGAERTLSPIMINDNLIDIEVTPGKNLGEPAIVSMHPQTGYLHIINKIDTVLADSSSSIGIEEEHGHQDGSRTITLTGAIAANEKHFFIPYSVYEPARFAKTLLQEALHQQGVTFAKEPHNNPRGKLTLVAEHQSPPLSETTKIILKVSHGLHAATIPYLLGSLAKDQDQPTAGFAVIRDFLAKANLNLSQASMNDGAGENAYFSPAFMTSFLRYVHKQNYAKQFVSGLPVLGHDGTLYNTQVGTTAAGNIKAKTGTIVSQDSLNGGLVVDAKALAGYMTTKSGKKLAFALYLSNVLIKEESDIEAVGETLGKISSLAYDHL